MTLSMARGEGGGLRRGGRLACAIPLGGGARWSVRTVRQLPSVPQLHDVLSTRTTRWQCAARVLGRHGRKAGFNRRLSQSAHILQCHSLYAFERGSAVDCSANQVLVCAVTERENAPHLQCRMFYAICRERPKAVHAVSLRLPGYGPGSCGWQRLSRCQMVNFARSLFRPSIAPNDPTRQYLARSKQMKSHVFL